MPKNNVPLDYMEDDEVLPVDREGLIADIEEEAVTGLKNLAEQ